MVLQAEWESDRVLQAQRQRLETGGLLLLQAQTAVEAEEGQAEAESADPTQQQAEQAVMVRPEEDREKQRAPKVLPAQVQGPRAELTVALIFQTQQVVFSRALVVPAEAEGQEEETEMVETAEMAEPEEQEAREEEY